MWFEVLFGVLILVAVAISLVRPDMPMTNRTLVAGGLASGLMGTITSVSAPPHGIGFSGGSRITGEIDVIRHCAHIKSPGLMVSVEPDSGDCLKLTISVESNN